MYDKTYRAVFQAMDPVTENRHPILLISVGKEYHEGPKLLSTIELLNRSGFKRCTIMLADSLQRYNFLPNMPHKEAHQLAINLGDQWIERNSHILNLLIIPYEIKRWENYREELFCQPHRELLIQSYHTDISVKKAIDTTINGYINRQDIVKIKPIYNEIYKNCFDYVVEECPILMPLWAYQGYDYIIYPKKMTHAMRITYEKFVLPYYPEKVIWLPLRFRKKASA